MMVTGEQVAEKATRHWFSEGARFLPERFIILRCDSSITVFD